MNVLKILGSIGAVYLLAAFLLNGHLPFNGPPNYKPTLLEILAAPGIWAILLPASLFMKK